MGEVAIVIPTHGRAGSVSTFKVFPMAILCVAESQEKLYREAYPDKEIVVHPDSIKGLASKRQWIYDYWGDVFQVDDDITAMTDLSVAAGEEALENRLSEKAPGIVIAFEIEREQIAEHHAQSITLTSPLKWDQVQCALLAFQGDDELVWFATQEIDLHLAEWN